MLVEVGKFTFPADFVILEMEEDSKVPLILGRPFLHTADAVIQVKQETNYNLGVGTELMIFHIDFAMKHSYSNDDTCFGIDVIDQILEEDFDALLDEGSEIIHSIEGTILEEKLFAEFDEFRLRQWTAMKFLNPNPLESSIDYWKIMNQLQKPFSVAIHGTNRCKRGHILSLTGKMSLHGKRGIGTWYKVSEAGLEVDKAKIEVISKLPPPNIKEFDIEIKDIKGTENVAADHLSRIENDETNDDSEVDANFPGETLMEINTRNEPWFANFENYLVSDIIPKGMTYQQNNKFFSDLKHYFWEEPYLFKVCSNAYKTPTGTTPYKLVYGKNCHLPFEIEHYAYWALKNCNPDLIATSEKQMFQLHELDELRHQAYENSRLYKARTKVWHDRKLKMRKDFKHGNKVLLFHSKYKFKQPKLRSRWLGPYVVKHQYPSGYVELYGKDGKTFIVNGHRLKLYHEEEDYNDQREAVTPFFPKE
ncbi:reverse transcriptase domain-containing protein [Tanacetum coccineum]